MRLSMTYFVDLRYLPDWAHRHIQSFLACHTLQSENGIQKWFGQFSPSCWFCGCLGVVRVVLFIRFSHSR